MRMERGISRRGGAKKAYQKAADAGNQDAAKALKRMGGLLGRLFG